MIPNLQEYENFIYSLPTQVKSIKISTLVVKHTSKHTAQIIGTMLFDKRVMLRVRESVSF